MKAKIIFVNGNPPGTAERILPPILAQAILNRMERDKQQNHSHYIVPKAS